MPSATKTAHISDVQAVKACAAYHAELKLFVRAAQGTMKRPALPAERLKTMTGCPLKVGLRAIERAIGRGLLDSGISNERAFLTGAGQMLMEAEKHGA